MGQPDGGEQRCANRGKFSGRRWLPLALALPKIGNNKMDKTLLTNIVIGTIISEVVKRVISFIENKSKSTTAAKTAKNIVKRLINKSLIILLLQVSIFLIFIASLLKFAHSSSAVTNYSVFSMIILFLIVLRVGNNSLQALKNYIEKVKPE